MTGLPTVRAALAQHGLELVRAWPRGPEHLLLHVRPLDEHPAWPVAGWLAGQWFADDARAAAVAARTRAGGGPGDRSDGPVRDEARAGCRHLVGTGVVVQPGGADRRLVGLRPLLEDPGSVLVAHRPERRAVVRSSTGRVFSKVVPPARVDGLLASAAWRPGGVRVPDVLCVDRELGVVATAALPGRTLHDLGPAATASAWAAAGAAVAALHASTPPDHARDHGTAAEAAVTRTWLERAVRHRALEPRRAAALWAEARQALARLEAGPGGTPATTHRDLHDKQVLLAGDDTTGWSAGVLDLDLVAVAEPALDLANLLVHLALRDVQRDLLTRSADGPRPAHPTGPLGGCHRAPARAEAFLAGYGPLPDVARVHDLAVVAAARVAAVYAFRAPVGAPAGARPASRPEVPDVGGAELGPHLLDVVRRGLPGLVTGRAA